MQIVLVLSTPESKPVEIPLKVLPCLIGRSEECHLRLKSSSVSRKHCELKIKHDRLTVKDLESRNGTLVDGVPIPALQRIVLKQGSVLQVGKYQLAIRLVYPGENKSRILGGAAAKVTPSTASLEVAGVDLSTWVDDADQDTVERVSAIEPIDQTIPEAAVQPVQEPTLDSKVNLPVNEGEQRLQELREKLKGEKARDSQAAAQQALRRLFGKDRS